jgi:hypothetical protein
MAEAEHFPRQRYYSNRVAAFFISKALGQFMEDTQCGFRLYPREALQAISLKTSRYQMETEVLIKAARKGIPLRSVPVKNIYGEEDLPRSNFRPILDTFSICLVVLQGYLRLF